MAGGCVASASTTNIWIFCFILVISSLNFTTSELNKEMVREWANRIGKETFNFTRTITHEDDLQQSYEALNVSTTNVDGLQLLSWTKGRFEKYFNKKITALKNIVNKAENAYCNHHVKKKLELSEIDYPNSKDLDQYLNASGIRLEYNPYYLQNVTFNRSTIHVPTDVYEGSAKIVNGIEWSKELNEAFSQNEKADPSIAWQYFASNTGFMRLYPGGKWREEPGQVDLYDARSRSWFIQGATSPKDVVIILDASGSMRGVPMRIAQYSAQALIDTFEDNDYFNVVWFNKEKKVLLCNENNEKKLIQATKKNKQAAKEQIEKNIKDENMAHWELGVTLAFDLLDKARKDRKGSQCQQALMIFSDGTTKNLKDLYAKRNPQKRVRVFTYPVGPPAESTTAMHQMSSRNRGYFSRIQSVGAVRSVSESYIQVLSRPMAMAPKKNVSQSAVWTAVYLDALGLGMMVTGTMPVFYRLDNNCSKAQKNSYNHLIGVAGTDVPLKNLEEFLLQPLMGPNAYALGINNNGLIAFHPRLKTVFGYLPDAPGVDLMDAEFPLNKADLEQLRSGMINRTFSSLPSNPKIKVFKVYDVSRDELRVVMRELKFFYDSLKDSSFSFGFATPEIGFKYVLSPDVSLEQLADELKSSDLKLAKWPYCDGTVFAANPIEKLKTKNLSCNQDMLNGLAIDLNATSHMSSIWKTDQSLYTDNQINSVFAKTYYGVTRQQTFSAVEPLYHPSQNDFGRVASSDANASSVVYTSPFTAGKRERNSSSVIAFKKVLYSDKPVAVTGFQMDSGAFSKMVFDKTKNPCSTGNCADVNCDRSGKNDQEGYYCYLLDENAFVVSSNYKQSSGKFFGKVDNTVMKLLIKNNSSSFTGIYNKVVFTDYQAVCQRKASFGNSGTSLLGPLFTLSSYVDWWTTKAMWFFMYFNVYSWLMSETKSFTEATEDQPKNYSCIKKVTTYYADKLPVLQNGTASCVAPSCSRPFVVANVPNSNMYLVVVDAKCGECHDSSAKVGLPGEPSTVDDVPNQQCKQELYRKRPQRCFETDNPESEYPAGNSRSLAPSVALVTATLLIVSKYILH